MCPYSKFLIIKHISFGQNDYDTLSCDIKISLLNNNPLSFGRFQSKGEDD